MISPLISYYVTEKVFIKRQPHTDELGLDLYGNPVVSPYVADRLKNEAAALQYLQKNTAIPVPEFLGLQTINGLVYLKMAWIPGAIELRAVPAARMDAAIAAVTAELEADIFPQLRNLRSNRMGSADPELPIIPPRRFWDWKESRVWTSIPGEYTFCHLDLDRQNILVDPKTYKIVAIIDWEMAGFFPPEWELELWKQKTREEKFNLIESAKEREAGFFSGWLSTDEKTEEKKDTLRLLTWGPRDRFLDWGMLDGGQFRAVGAVAHVPWLEAADVAILYRATWDIGSTVHAEAGW
ncbi:hypothetical protein LLEC1_01291 [Akanthomyces lecanii]|uniref:Aminoglycoside phosphotransferase domain-containing protein n=1 Tax=Cordyceps confragosa TaxID=2714763 RepID=A0A179IL88_CORDF|nr:hypothetical protein LLEC1_01291 [Akanthomyces lecanii]